MLFLLVWFLEVITPEGRWSQSWRDPRLVFSVVVTASFSPSAGSRPTVQHVASLGELPQALQPYYTQGYVLAALHPIILSVGRTRSLPFSLLYRAVLARPKPRYNRSQRTCCSQIRAIGLLVIGV